MAVTRGETNTILKDLTLLAEDTVAQTRPTLVPLISHMETEEGAYTKVPVPANLPFPAAFDSERRSFGKAVNVVQTYDQKTYELTVDIDSDLLRNAKAYSFGSLVREAAMAAAIFPDYLMSQAVVNGATNTAYDGVSFYGTTHKFAKMGSNSISNLLTGTGTSIPFLFNDLGTAIAAIRGYRDNTTEGRLLNPVSAMGSDAFTVQCPLSMEQNFRAVLNADMIPQAINSGIQTVAGSPMTNTLKGAAGLFPDGYLSGSNWYLHFTGMPQRPFVFFENYGIQVQVLGFGSEWEINNNAVRIALKHRFVMGYHRFDRSVKTTN